jgi:hypothetical protein
MMEVLAGANIAVGRMVLTREQGVIRFLVHKYAHPKFLSGWNVSFDGWRLVLPQEHGRDLGEWSHQRRPARSMQTKAPKQVYMSLLPLILRIPVRTGCRIPQMLSLSLAQLRQKSPVLLPRREHTTTPGGHWGCAGRHSHIGLHGRLHRRRFYVYSWKRAGRRQQIERGEQGSASAE